MSKQKIVLAYSGGLDTSVAIKWLSEKYGYDVIAVALDVGEGKDLDFIKQKALQVGAVQSIVIDAKEWFAKDFLAPALKANAMYEGKYPLVSALSRPLISQALVRVAREEGAVAVAHGCTGKGNDQVRFELSVKALHPDLHVVAPVREWAMSREEEIAYASQHNIPIPVDLDNPYSIDQNLWGRSCECGQLENPWAAPPEGAYEWTRPLTETPDTPVEIEITFHQGIPTHLDGKEMPLHQLLSQLNQIAGEHGIGRIDHVENRLVGIKSREVYECPAAVMLINAHKELEFLTQTREVAQFKPLVEQKWAQLTYDGLWFSPLKQALDAFIDETQKYVSGKVRVKCFKGHATVTGRDSKYSLYNEQLATYTTDDTFDHQAAVGFIKCWGYPTHIYANVHCEKEEQNETLGRTLYQANQPIG
ncbi:argininosuccinate synthase [Paenactinomyces guangxiensis]|uniref:Argininosuccinate synthase n=1 Tax=Paenactinomyces guangxiensis TaxID=1490290 RepID=A0A7W1WSP3_9BACL|nr:argininosuccinate synthase [Paenactinomyces guangxiensis]MBA4495339.1 argininosuccinate synthase [Paenactinomyces guangxiensis]MBH8592540.1 argininosuccinate synthase [Paenactinomyces guangxiensis]